jgi:uncharacterized RDD family membrane protein YckC
MTDTRPVVPWEAPAEEAGPAPGISFAGHGARLVAYIIDTIILTVIWVALLIAFGGAIFDGLDMSDPENPILDPSVISASVGLTGAILLVTLIYFPLFWATGGQTPGMRPFGIRVVRDRDGGRIGWGAAILRMIGFWIGGAAFYIGYIWVFIDGRRRAWHDLIAGTVVIRRP